ncbi:molybdate ABC transporter permease subunit [Tindallia californiensis]|uniref:Molybdenum transport system permease n=1 Tax=Tindallia californiensis TaxID=159292 RepID=A0A1H3Q626_9FIRM|nr:molybdate ABC transporter permease subunit [Tindallia californiensis]SDZ08475.1 molybdate transport system permease protein [Tindallia californiensis]
MNWSPVYLSLKIALHATLIAAVLGIPMAWLLSRTSFLGKNLLASLVTLPLVMPPTVLGYYLLVLLGNQGVMGRWLHQQFNISLVFTWQGAVLAATLVSFPLMVKAVQSGMDAVDQDLEDVARTMGKSEVEVFFRVTLPLAWSGILSGSILTFARAMGEFGATLMIAGSIPGKTQTLSVAIYDAVQGGDYQQANFLVMVISGMTIAVLLFLGQMTQGKRW